MDKMGLVLSKIAKALKVFLLKHYEMQDETCFTRRIKPNFLMLIIYGIGNYYCNPLSKEKCVDEGMKQTLEE